MINEIENNIIKLKANVYDIIRKQEELANQNSQLQNEKIRMSQEIQSLEAKLALETQLAETKVAKP